jgi:hypothetical protein
MKIKIISFLIVTITTLFCNDASGAQAIDEVKNKILNTRPSPKTGVFKADVDYLIFQMEKEEQESIDIRKILLEISPMLIPSDFSPMAQQILENEFYKDQSKDNIMLAGLINNPKVLKKIKRISDLSIEDPGVGRFYGSPIWAASLVMARCGNNAKIQKIIEIARKEDIHTQVVFLFRDLAYVKQYEIVEYLVEYLYSLERLESPKETVLGLYYAAYVAAALSRMLINFPVPYKEDYSYTEEEINCCRSWMSDKRNWIFRNNIRSE